MRFYNIDMNILIELSDHSNRLIKDKSTNYGAERRISRLYMYVYVYVYKDGEAGQKWN